MKTSMIVLVALCLTVMSAQAFPTYGYGRPMIQPYPVYAPYRPGFVGAPARGGFGGGRGLQLLTSAALLGSGSPLGRTLGGIGLIGSVFEDDKTY